MGCVSSKKAPRKEAEAQPEAPSTSAPVDEWRQDELDGSAVLSAPVALPSVSAWTQVLTRSASQGDTHMVVRLLKEERDGSSAAGRTCGKQDVDSVDGEGWTPLMWAARNGHTDIVKVLLAHGAHADAIKVTPPMHR